MCVCVYICIHQGQSQIWAATSVSPRQLLAHEADNATVEEPVLTAHLIPMDGGEVIGLTSAYDEYEGVYFLTYNTTRAGSYTLQVGCRTAAVHHTPA